MTAATLGLVVAAQWLALALVMSLAWIIERRTGNSGYIDTTWSFGVAGVAAASALWPGGDGTVSARQYLIAVMILGWGLRLGLHILKRSGSKSEDPRYADMIRKWGPNAGREMFSLLQKQAAVAVPLALAVFLAAHNPAPGLTWLDAGAVAIYLAAFTGETLADRQLRDFIAKPENHGRICDAGLWRYSRHPNYFFEWLHWTAYPLAAINLTGGEMFGWLALLAPAVMYWLLVYISGVPPLEEHMLRKHGERYRAYQLRTNAFFPGPVKHV